ncbi:MAG: DUF3416 domain-containing protein, partial [Rhizobiales bacterium]|nr:DUF3416 domain-containing protein [Hyphomicrobiales bacterium]
MVFGPTCEVTRRENWNQSRRFRFHFQAPPQSPNGTPSGSVVTANVTLSAIVSRRSRRIAIEDVYPSVDGGRYPAKRIAGEPIEVWADIFRDGHAVLAAEVLWRAENASRWVHVSMRLHQNDRWMASFTPPKAGRYVYAVEAWTDHYATWRHDFLAKRDAGLDVALEEREGRLLLDKLNAQAHASTQADITNPSEVPEAVAQAAARVDQDDLTRSTVFPLTVDRPLARAGAWYEMVPRSQGKVAGRHGTFDDCIARLPEIASLGFDVIYLTPIHPIGTTNRKGRNNALKAKPGDPGSFYAIGSEAGGHDAIHPELGTLDDFQRLVAACADHGLELALDFAVQCSPDHPWVKDHPDWFKRRLDGSIQYAENPPKKYEDIVNPDFY